MTYLRPFLAIYGTGMAGTFVWLFFALSGVSTCAASLVSCRLVLGLAGQLALVWPAYWGGRLSGDPAVTPLVPVEVVVVAVLVFLIVLTLAGAYNLMERPKPDESRIDPLIKINEPNRRDQSRAPLLARSNQS